MLILVLNPGSTSLKLAIYENETMRQSKKLVFAAEMMERLRDPDVRASYCQELIEAYLRDEGVSVESLDCIASRGGVLGKVNTGAYTVNEKMVEFVRNSPSVVHSVGVMIGYNMMSPLGKPCIIYDAVSADEWDPIAKVSGIKGYERITHQHTLNTREIVSRLAVVLGKPVTDVNAIVSHLGGGIDTTFFRGGRIIESLTYNDLGFSPDRCGAVNVNDLLDMTEQVPISELHALNRGKGGLVSHFGTADEAEVEVMMEAGDEYAALVLEAMAYRVAQCIGAGAVALEGKIDGIVLTGGIARSEYVTEWITRRVSFLGKIFLMPGEFEVEALAAAALRVIKGEEQTQEY